MEDDKVCQLEFISDSLIYLNLPKEMKTIDIRKDISKYFLIVWSAFLICQDCNLCSYSDGVPYIEMGFVSVAIDEGCVGWRLVFKIAGVILIKIS